MRYPMEKEHRKQPKDRVLAQYAQKELFAVSARLKDYLEFGVTPNLQPVVDILVEAQSKLNKLLENNV